MRKEPDIAILMATYNGEKYLEEQLDSLVHQSYNNFVCYIHDDGSSDGTKEIINKYVKLYPDMFSYVDGKQTGGAKNNFMFLLGSVEADYYMFCDQDDIWHKEKIEETYEYYMQVSKNEPTCVYSDLSVVDKNRNIINDSFYAFSNLDPHLNSYKQILMSNICVGCTMFFDRQIRDIALSIQTDNIIMHDWLIALVAALMGKLYFLDEQLIEYRQHDNNVEGATREFGLLRKMFRAIDYHEYKKRKEYFICRPRLMAGDLLCIQELDVDSKEFLHAFSTIGMQKKMIRIKFYHANRLYRQRIMKIWQLLHV